MNTNKNHIKTGFKTPDNYFDVFENNILEQLKFEKKTGFTVPENYFDTLESDVLKRIEPSKTKVISFISKKQLAYISTIAATLVFCFFVLKPSDMQNITFDDIEYSAYEDYFSIEDINITSDELAEMFDINSNDLDEISFSKIEDDNILNYLSEETISEDYFDNNL